MNDLYRGALKYFTGTEMKRGEYHVPTINENISIKNPLPFSTSSRTYAGPGTKIVSRVRESKPDENTHLSFLQLVSKKHDLEYSLSKSADDIKLADNKMINALA